MGSSYFERVGTGVRRLRCFGVWIRWLCVLASCVSLVLVWFAEGGCSDSGRRGCLMTWYLGDVMNWRVEPGIVLGLGYGVVEEEMEVWIGNRGYSYQGQSPGIWYIWNTTVKFIVAYYLTSFALKLKGGKSGSQETISRKVYKWSLGYPVLEMGWFMCLYEYGI